jgi:hypothetical protein
LEVADQQQRGEEVKKFHAHINGVSGHNVSVSIKSVLDKATS